MGEARAVKAFKRKRRADRKHAAWRPCPSTFHALGVKASTMLPVDCTYGQIAKRFKISKQRAYYECMVALGRLVFAIGKLSRKNGVSGRVGH